MEINKLERHLGRRVISVFEDGTNFEISAELLIVLFTPENDGGFCVQRAHL